MPTVVECICHNGIPEVVNVISTEPGVQCITQHSGFAPVCLNVWVLQTAYSQYRQQYGNYSGSLNEFV
jgi:hypothetical protein